MKGIKRENNGPSYFITAYFVIVMIQTPLVAEMEYYDIQGL